MKSIGMPRRVILRGERYSIISRAPNGGLAVRVLWQKLETDFLTAFECKAPSFEGVIASHVRGLPHVKKAGTSTVQCKN